MPLFFKRKPKQEAPSPHTINRRRLKRGYRRMGAINLFEAEHGGNLEISDYETWLKKKEDK